MYQIDIYDSQGYLDIDSAQVQEQVEQTLAAEELLSATISIAIVDNETIHELNRKYLNHDFATDVLSFLLECDPEANSPELPRGRGKRIEGEIIISAEMAVESASEFHWSPAEEFVLYLVHGILHLCGYDDLTVDERELMRSRETQILKCWKLKPHYVD
jgi:probable rRNA maturation factor